MKEYEGVPGQVSVNGRGREWIRIAERLEEGMISFRRNGCLRLVIAVISPNPHLFFIDPLCSSGGATPTLSWRTLIWMWRWRRVLGARC